MEIDLNTVYQWAIDTGLTKVVHEFTSPDPFYRNLESFAAKAWLEGANHTLKDDVKLNRLRRKLQRKDVLIEKLNARIKVLESAISRKTSVNVSKDVYKAVQSALSNVRMIPIFPLGADDKIV